MKKVIYLMLLLCSLSAQAQVYTRDVLVSRIPSIDNRLPDSKDTVIEITEKLGYVFSVHDGDSYTMQFAEKTKARIAFIDFPEIAWPRIPATQPYGRAFGDSVRNMIKGKIIKYEILGYDKYERAIVDCNLNGKDLQLIFLEKGWCWLIPKKRGEADGLSVIRRRKYQRAQSKAKDKKLGLWAGYTNNENEWVPPIEPWVFRKMNALPSEQK